MVWTWVSPNSLPITSWLSPSATAPEANECRRSSVRASVRSIRAENVCFHHDVNHIPYQANRNLEVISELFTLAEPP